MNCPKCGNGITSLVRRCKSCRTDFGENLYDKFAFYFTWQEELEKLKELQNSLFGAIANVSAKIRRYEAVLTRDLERLDVAPVRSRRKAGTAKKNKRR